MAAEAIKLRADRAGLAVDLVFRKVVAEHALPVRLAGVVDGVPVPVHDAARAAGDVAVRLQPQLAGIRRPVGKALCLRLQQQVIAAAQRAGHVAAKGDLRARERILAGVVDVHAGNRQALRRMEVIRVRLHAIGMAAPLVIQVVRDELVLPAVFVHDPRLPAEEPRHQAALEFFKRRAQAAVDRAAHVREVLPGVHAVAPVIQAEGAVHLAQIIVKHLPQVLHKLRLHGRARRAVVLGLVVDLKADDAFPVRRALHQLADDALGIVEVDGMGDVHDLARAVALRPLLRLRQHVGMGLHHPGGHRVRRRADDHADARLLHRIHHALHM